MIKYNFIISLLLLLGFSQVHAQFSNHVDGHVDPLVGNTNEYLVKVKSVDYSDGIAPIGSATVDDYYDQNWQAVSITFDNNTILKYDKARYNLNIQILEVQFKDKV